MTRSAVLNNLCEVVFECSSELNPSCHDHDARDLVHDGGYIQTRATYQTGFELHPKCEQQRPVGGWVIFPLFSSTLTSATLAILKSTGE
jgi:hypothetical protein